MSTIEIEHPMGNWDLHRRQFYESGFCREILHLILQDKGVTPQTHPRVYDLFAGDGGVAATLVEYGWDVSNITCIDRHVPDPPIGTVQQAHWLYWELRALSDALVTNEPLSPYILAHQQKADIVTAVFAQSDKLTDLPFSSDELQRITSFFIKLNGFVYSD
ncbi:hypothetical protein KKB64_02545 [Patescibacteria group bacterium]|nr:hypothetical protein [Patescibacteria group bacterium]MBU2460156.1 hypothetical protein [Patescibacteria group bacterium]MBU2544419.1 hypothetical protein [Patescibacteria group bacterium]